MPRPVYMDEIDEDTRNPLEGWRRSQKGNLYKRFDEITLTIFTKGNWFGVCLHDGDQPHFSHRGFGTELLAAEFAEDWLLEYLDEYEIVDEIIVGY